MNVTEIESYVEGKRVWSDASKVKIIFQKKEGVQILGEIKNNRWKILMSDYFQDMPDEDAKMMMDMYVKMNKESNYNIEYNKIEYINSAQIAIEMQETFLKRVRAGPILTKGDVYDLEVISKDLIRRGLVSPDVLKNTIITYVDNLDPDIGGNAEVILRVVRIDYDNDQEEIPLCCMESLLLHELIHIEIGLETLYDPHGKEFHRRMSRYDRLEELYRWGKENSLTEEELIGYQPNSL